MSAVDGIRDAFFAERARLVAENPPREEAPRACRYCGKYRLIYPGTALDGHVLCMVSEEFQLVWARTIDECHLSFVEVAAATGMSISVVRRWYRAGKGWPAR